MLLIFGELCQIARPSGATMKQNVRFQVGIFTEKSQLNQLQNGRQSAIINFNMPHI